MVIQNDGQILVGGRILDDSLVSDFILIRYNANGSLDNSFGAGGVVITDFSTSDNLADIAIQSGTPTTPDKIVVAGSQPLSRALSLNSRWPAITLTGVWTRVLVLAAKSSRRWATTTAWAGLAIQSVNSFLRKIIVAGDTVTNGERLFSVVRYNADGSLDGSFGSGGKASAPGQSQTAETASRCSQTARLWWPAPTATILRSCASTLTVHSILRTTTTAKATR